jgi:hypothetical protein
MITISGRLHRAKTRSPDLVVRRVHQPIAVEIAGQGRLRGKMIAPHSVVGSAVDAIAVAIGGTI